ncbi:MAG: hypothetical protein ACI9MU_004224, partial [Alphaproteobacteria bacterium]
WLTKTGIEQKTCHFAEPMFYNHLEESSDFSLPEL